MKDHDCCCHDHEHEHHHEHAHEHEHCHEHSHEHEHCHGHSHEDYCPHCAAKLDGSAKRSDAEEHRELFCLISGAILFAAGMILHLLGGYVWLTFALFLISYLILGSEILIEAVKNLAHGHLFDENFLMSLATIGAFAIREYPEAAGVMLFYRIGEYFEEIAASRSRGEIMKAVDLRPETVIRISGSETTQIPAKDAQIGDLLLIRPGDRIPLDGVILEGESRLDTSPVTGEPVPVAVHAGSNILSGCVNLSGVLKLRVEKPLEDSMVSRILHSVENAAANKPAIERFITRFAKIYTPCVVIAALATAVLPSLITGDWQHWIYTALTFLVISCPCALVLSVPLAFFSAIGAASKKGILLKGGASLEALNHLGAVVMDKTGTLTEGNFVLQHIVSLDGTSEEELLRLCASCEQHSSHPIAHSILAEAKKRQLPLETPSDLHEIAGHGVLGTLKAGNVLCGNLNLMVQHKIDLSDIKKAPYGAEVYIAVNGQPAGYLVISDTIRADARDAVYKLKTMGLHTVMLTGDSSVAAQAVADLTGIDEVHAHLLPDEKLNELQKLRKTYGAVMFVGDGINDAPVLAGADVGAAMGTGADMAIEAADAVFMTSSVTCIPRSVRIARRTNRIAMENVVFALLVKLFVMILGLTGYANMWMAVFADTGVAMLCILNSIRILYQKQEVQ